MSLDRETVYQIAVATGAVLLFIGAAAAVSLTFSRNGHISETGGLALVGTIVLFIVVMAGAGLWLNAQDFGDVRSVFPALGRCLERDVEIFLRLVDTALSREDAAEIVGDLGRARTALQSALVALRSPGAHRTAHNW